MTVETSTTGNYIIKLSNDTATLSLLPRESMFKSEEEIDPRSGGDLSPVLINWERVERVTFASLGTHFDFQAQWSHQVEYACSQINQHLCFLQMPQSMEWLKALCYCFTSNEWIYYSIWHHSMVW